MKQQNTAKHSKTRLRFSEAKTKKPEIKNFEIEIENKEFDSFEPDQVEVVSS